MNQGKRVAILDLGSNSIRVVVMSIDSNGSYKMIDQFKDMVKLSEGMSEDKLLKDFAMDRTMEALKLFKNMIQSHQVTQTIALATAAVRNAQNGSEFLDRIYKETGFRFQVITGEEEAYLDYLGVINTIAIDDCIIIDTGGGSTELVLVENRIIQNSISLPFGAVTLSEIYLEEEDSKSELKKVESFMKNLYKSIPWLKGKEGLLVVGLGGSIRTLGKIYKRKENKNKQPLHNLYLSSEDAKSIVDNVWSMKKADRKEIPGLGKDRVDTIAGGLVPLKALLSYVKADGLIISGNGLREGAFYRYYLEKNTLDEYIVDDVLQHSIHNLMLKYDMDIGHSELVKKLSMDLFYQLLDLHGIEERYDRLLEIGALLHDIGLYVSYYDHHYHGYYLTLNSRLNGLTFEELVHSSFIVGMHRNEDFKQDVSEYIAIIGEEEYAIAQKLATLVRLAEEICKSQNGYIKEIKCKLSKEEVHLMLIAEDNTPQYMAESMQSGKSFKKIFNRGLRVSY